MHVLRGVRAKIICETEMCYAFWIWRGHDTHDECCNIQGHSILFATFIIRI